MERNSFIFIFGILLFCGIIFYLAEKEPKIKRKKEIKNNTGTIDQSLKKYENIKQNKSINFIKNKIYYESSYEILRKVKFEATPREFEIFCALLYEALGYSVELTKYEHDGGKDLVLNGNTVVECKKFITQVVGREICQKLLGAMHQNKANAAIVINTNKFNFNAREVALQVDELKLIDFYGIINLLEKIGIEKANQILIKTFDKKENENYF